MAVISLGLGESEDRIIFVTSKSSIIRGVSALGHPELRHFLCQLFLHQTFLENKPINETEVLALKRLQHHWNCGTGWGSCPLHCFQSYQLHTHGLWSWSLIWMEQWKTYLRIMRRMMQIGRNGALAGSQTDSHPFSIETRSKRLSIEQLWDIQLLIFKCHYKHLHSPHWFLK